MAQPPSYQRAQHAFKGGRVDQWGDRTPTAEAIAELVRYGGNGKHKRYPAPNGEWRPVFRPGCFECARFAEASWPQLVAVLREAIRLSCVQLEPNERFPRRVWAYINGTLHEAKITNSITGEYHGMPLEYESQKPDDPHNLLRNAPNVTIPVI